MNYTPGAYAPSCGGLTSNSVKTKSNVTVKDVLKFFVQYMKNDQLGMIANAHLGNSELVKCLTRQRTLIVTLTESKILDALVLAHFAE
jgi:RNA dependent RNA polymerase